MDRSFTVASSSIGSTGGRYKSNYLLKLSLHGC